VLCGYYRGLIKAFRFGAALPAQVQPVDAQALDQCAEDAQPECFASINGVQINYRCYGNPTDPALLLIMGLATQRTAWPPAWIRAFVQQSRYVITFDHRDIGLSTRFDQSRAPGLLNVYLRSRLGLALRLPYQLRDLANDALGLLDFLQIQRADVLGISMGGMVAQWLASMAPEKVNKLLIVMSASGHSAWPLPRMRLLSLLRSRPVSSDAREAAQNYLVALFSLIGSPAYRSTPERLRQWAALQVNRSMAGSGALRQLAAIVGDTKRVQALSKISAQTTVYHGSADILVPLAHGRDLARRIPSARFVELAGLGHDLPEQLAEYFASQL
jgi:pimeloyl-ACP methyl ester carboxylesterase